MTNLAPQIKLTPIIALNLVPLFCVYAFDWQVFEVILIYWAETLVIGFFSMLLMVFTSVYKTGLFSGLLIAAFPAIFFTIHFGGFTMGHGIFVGLLFGEEVLKDRGFPVFGMVSYALENKPLLWALAGLFVVQLFDFISKLKNSENSNLKTLMFSPYKRVIVLHITLILSGFLVGLTNGHLLGLALLILIKTGIEVLQNKPKADDSPIEERKKAFNEKLEQFMEKPAITVNGEEKCFASWNDLYHSKDYRRMKKLMSITGSGKTIKAIDERVLAKIAEEQMATPLNTD